MKNAVFSAKILESQSSSENHQSHREQLKLESTFHSIFTNNTHSPSLRDFALAKAQQSTSNNLESTFEKTQMDCHADKSARNDRKNAQNVSEQQNDSKHCGGALRVWRSAKSRAKPLLQTTYNTTLSVLDKCAHRLRKPFIADKEGYCKHCGYRLYKPQWLQELEAKHAIIEVDSRIAAQKPKPNSPKTPKTKGQK